jgi:predicted nucleic acid-binding protein
MATKYPLNNIPAIQHRQVFFDANILIYIFWPSGAYHWEGYYSTALARLMHQQNELFVDFTVISETVNRAHRLEYDKFLTLNHMTKTDTSYKHYRNGLDGQSALSDIYSMVETNILTHFTVVGKTFSKEDIQSFLVVDAIDFNDKGIIMTCKENNFVLLTNDSDFKAADIDILSSNPAILR